MTQGAWMRAQDGTGNLLLGTAKRSLPSRLYNPLVYTARREIFRLPEQLTHWLTRSILNGDWTERGVDFCEIWNEKTSVSRAAKSCGGVQLGD